MIGLCPYNCSNKTENGCCKTTGCINPKYQEVILWCGELASKFDGKAEGQEEQKEPCWACEGLENGDTLYSMSDWDGGIGFDYIRDIQYCPVCGRKL